jgi:hypothetical protein
VCYIVCVTNKQMVYTVLYCVLTDVVAVGAYTITVLRLLSPMRDSQTSSTNRLKFP